MRAFPADWACAWRRSARAATNLISGLPVAYMSSTPVLALTGQVQTRAYANSVHQESIGWFRTPKQEAIYAATVKQTFTCNEIRRFPDFVRHAIRIAVSGRPGPAHLIIPANLLHQDVDFAAIDPEQYRLLAPRPCDATAIEVIAARIREARFPILIAGERVMLPDATCELEALDVQCAIPGATNLACKSAVDKHSPMFIGCLGVVGHKAAERYLKEKSDLVITVGQTFNEISTLSWDPAISTEGRLIQLDSDPEEIGKVYPVSAATDGHLPEILLQLAVALGDLAGPARAERERTIAQLRGKSRYSPKTLWRATQRRCSHSASSSSCSRHCRRTRLSFPTPHYGLVGWDAISKRGGAY